jgi:hypothetical protein
LKKQIKFKRKKRSPNKLLVFATMSSWDEIAKRGAVVGAVAGVATYMLYGSGGSVNVFGARIPAAAGVGVAAAVGSAAADLTHDFLPVIVPIGNIGTTATELAVSGLATASALDFLGINNGISLEGIGVGAGSLLAGRYVSQELGLSNSFLY